MAAAVQRRKRISLKTLALYYRHAADTGEPLCYICGVAFSATTDKQLRRHVHTPTLQHFAWSALLCDKCEGAAALGSNTDAAYCCSCFTADDLTRVPTKDGVVVLCAKCVQRDAAQLAHKGAAVV
jgi:hypothetical protein